MAAIIGGGWWGDRGEDGEEGRGRGVVGNAELNCFSL